MTKVIDFELPEGATMIHEVMQMFRGKPRPTGWAVYQTKEKTVVFREVIPGKAVVDYIYYPDHIARLQMQGVSSLFPRNAVFKAGSWGYGVLDYQLRNMAEGNYINAKEATRKYNVQVARERKQWKLQGGCSE